MKSTLHPGHRVRIGALPWLALVFAGAASSASLTTLYSFSGSDGSAPVATLTPGADGYLYGTTDGGGNNYKGQVFSGYGTIFRMAPSGMLTTLVKFDERNGATPNSQLVAGPGGVFYGTTVSGGSSHRGTIYRLAPGGALMTLVHFNGSNGAAPTASLIAGDDGSLYGTTVAGGSQQMGTLFRVTPAGGLTTLAHFGGATGSKPAQLVSGPAGLLIGTTLEGGSSGQGTVFKATANGQVSTLASFAFADGKGDHYTALIFDVDGSLYGASSWGGAYGKGSIFRIAASGALTVLASFNGSNGTYPDTRLTALPDGSFVGTTTAGGTNDKGTIFRVTRTGTITTLHSFNGTDGQEPYGALVQLGSSNSYFGTTQLGGAHERGTVFRFQL